jgi:hypothetical protein
LNFKQRFHAGAFVPEQTQPFCLASQTYFDDFDFYDLETAVVNHTVTFVAAMIELRRSLERNRVLNWVNALKIIFSD